MGARTKGKTKRGGSPLGVRTKGAGGGFREPPKSFPEPPESVPERPKPKSIPRASPKPPGATQELPRAAWIVQKL